MKTAPFTKCGFCVRDIEMHQEGLEPSAYRLEGDCSIRLSYWCMTR